MGCKAIAVLDGQIEVSRAIAVLLRAHGHDAYALEELATAGPTILERQPDRVLLGLEHDDDHAVDILQHLRDGGFTGQIIGVGEREWPASDDNASQRLIDEHWLKPLQASQLLTFAASLAALL